LVWEAEVDTELVAAAELSELWELCELWESWSCWVLGEFIAVVRDSWENWRRINIQLKRRGG
jgi:hypothetical protein